MISLIAWQQFVSALSPSKSHVPSSRRLLSEESFRDSDTAHLYLLLLHVWSCVHKFASEPCKMDVSSVWLDITTPLLALVFIFLLLVFHAIFFEIQAGSSEIWYFHLELVNQKKERDLSGSPSQAQGQYHIALKESLSKEGKALPAVLSKRDATKHTSKGSSS